MNSKESMGSVGENYAAVGARMLEIATARGIEKGIEVGVRAAMDYITEEKEKARKSRYDRRLHNTRLLLKNYRSFKKHAEGAIYNAKQVKESAIDILDGLDDAMLGNGQLRRRHQKEPAANHHHTTPHRRNAPLLQDKRRAVRQSGRNQTLPHHNGNVY